MPDQPSDTPPSVNEILRFRKQRSKKQRGKTGGAPADAARGLCRTSAQPDARRGDEVKPRTISIGESIEAHKGGTQSAASGIALNSDHQQLFSSVEKSRHRFTFLCVLLSVVFLAIVWHLQKPASQPPLAHEDGLAGSATGAPILPAQIFSPATLSGGGETHAEYPVLPGAVIALPEPNFPEKSVPEKQAALQSDTADDSIAPPDDAGSPGSPAAGAYENPAGAVAGNAATPATSAPTAAPFQIEEITLAAAGKSWVEVRDGSGKRLIYRTVDRGRLTLKGRPPFKVFIGNAGDIAVEYRGKPVVFTAQQGRSFARFTVGAQ